METKKEFKIVTLGEGRVGKTSLALKFVKNQFHENEVSSLNVSFYSKDVQVNGTQVTLHIWDTAGQERFHAISANYYKQSAGAILVYDITERHSFERVKQWVDELNSQMGTAVKVIIAGNKCDREADREVTNEDVTSYAKSIGATHILTSAKTGKGVNELFEGIAKLVIEADTKRPANAHRASRAKGLVLSSSVQPKTQSKNGGCC